MAVSLTHKIKPLSVKVSVSHTLQLCNGTVCHPPHFRVHIRPSGQHPRHRPAAVRSVVYGRMIEIYLVTSVAPIPMATMVNHEWGSMGQNYLKSLLALGFQAFLILVCVGIYAVLIQTIAATDDISGAIWACMGYTVLLCFTLFKTGSLAKSVFSAH